MSSCHVPSASLLRHLTRLVRSNFAPQPVCYIKQQQRCFSRSDKCSAKLSNRAQSPRARQAVRQIGASWASAHYKNGSAREQNESLMPLVDVFSSIWVRKDFADLGIHYRAGAKTPPEYILSAFLGTMKHDWTPVGIAQWFSATGAGALNSEGNCECECECYRV